MAAPNLKEVEWAIHELENEESTKSGYILLSALYIIRDHMTGQETVLERYSRSSVPESQEKLDQYGDSDFLRAIAGKEPSAAWAVMDELMDTLQAVNLNVYASVMRNLQEI